MKTLHLCVEEEGDMHPRILEEFDRICAEQSVSGSVLEIGAVPSDDTLLCIDSLKNATEKIGINLDGPHQYKDLQILKVNANSMDCFEDARFDAVLCNAVLEHDKFFWKTIAEIKRVTKSGGLVVIGVPGYVPSPLDRLRKARWLVAKVPIVRRYLGWVFVSTITHHVHNYPGDYYRFSPQAFESVFFEGMKVIDVHSLVLPPKIIGSAIKP